VLQLANAELSVDLQEPAGDRARLGPRYCSGGYIWQVHDRKVGPLLTGPEWPNPSPLAHNGQGLPESFRHSTTTGEPLLWNGPTGLAPGAGELRRNSAGGVSIADPCEWRMTRSRDQIAFHTEQQVANWSYELERTVLLRERTVVSLSQLTNRRNAPLILEWFAHPFFALREGRAQVTFPVGTTLTPNSGYELDGRELTFRRAFQGEHDGHLDHLTLPADQPFAATISHPQLQYVSFATDFVPFKCVIWANGNTLSLEPFLALHLAPGESRRWSLTYEFGERTR
jgi:hypothetical protein